MPPKTPAQILKKIEHCRLTQAKKLDLSREDIRLITIPPEVFSLSHLESLNLSNNAIQCVPEQIKQLTQLKRLDLRGNPLNQVADVGGLFVHYADFKRLNIPSRNIVGLKLTLFSHAAPEGLAECPHLTALDISNHRLTQIPAWLAQFSQLTELNLRNNKLQALTGLEGLANLSTLYLSFNQLSSVNELETLVNLSYLALSYNQLNSVSGLEKLINLSSLYLGVNQLSSVGGLETLVNLSSLDLGANKLSNISGLENLINLSSLSLVFNQLSSVSGLETLINLSSLDLSYNQLSSVSGLEKLINLSSLDLSGNQLNSFDELEKLINLSSLKLKTNQLSSVSGLEKLINLSSLDLSSNQLSNVSGLEKLINLSSLDLWNNKLSNVSGLENLVNLSSLDLGGNKLNSVSGLEKLINLSSLVLRNNQLSSVSGLETLVNLSSLNLRENQLSSVSELEGLANLSSLALSGNKLNSVSGLETLVNLSSLDLRGNQLSSVSGLEMLVNLSVLYLGGNQLSNISELKKQINLSFLELGYSQLINISGLETLNNLSTLDLRNNQLSSVSGLESLIHLETLDLGGNPALEKIDDEIFALPKLENLNIFGYQKKETAISYPPLEQLEPEGTYGEVNLFRVRNYLRQLVEGEQDYLYEAKLLIVGEVKAGKTSLMRKIKDPAYQIPEIEIDRTEGIDVVRWEFLHKEHNFQVNIWDFGGQEIYHKTHQFFLSKRALYVLVADNHKENTNFYYWFNVVNTLSEDSPILLVKNEKDNCSCDIDESALRGQFKNFEKSYATDLKTNSKDYSRLLEDIRHCLPQLPHIGTPQPKKWLDVRAELEKLAETKNYIDLQAYFAICERHGFKNDNDKLQLSETLHDLGTILHFQKDIQLEEILFLKPAWATQAVYHVLYNKAVKENFGKFTTAHLKQIWHEPEYKGMYSKLLQLMLNFKLCYQLTDCQNTYIAPQLLPIEPPSYTLETKDTVTVLYENYKFMPKGMLSQLIVALHKDIAEKQTLVWRNGVVLERNNTRAEIIENYGAREIRIRIVGQNCRDLMTEVLYELNKIHESYHNLKYKIELPCHCKEPYYFNYETLKEFANDRADIQCQKRDCRKMVDAHDLLGGILNVTTDKDGKIRFETSQIGVVNGDVTINQAGGDINDVENRSINVSGNSKIGVANTGDNATVNYTETHNTLNQKENAMLPEKPIKSSWANGLFYLVLVNSILITLGTIAGNISIYALPFVIIGSVLFVILAGILQLRQDDKLKEKGFIELTELVLKQLPLIGGILRDWLESKKKAQ